MEEKVNIEDVVKEALFAEPNSQSDYYWDYMNQRFMLLDDEE